MANLSYGTPTYKREEDPYDTWDFSPYFDKDEPIHTDADLGLAKERKEPDMNFPNVPETFIAGQLTPDHILRSRDTTIVFWQDGTKTLVKRSATDCPDDYHAFCAALAIKIFGSNSHLKKMLKDKTYIQVKMSNGKYETIKKSDLFATLSKEERKKEGET